MQTIESSTETTGHSTQQTTDHRPRTSAVGRHLDIALVVAVVGPPALIGLLMLLGLGFASAACAVFAVVFAITTGYDATWVWQRRADRENQCCLD